MKKLQQKAFAIIMRPNPLLELLRETPRQRWYRRRHAERFEKRYGQPPALYHGSLGTVIGVRFID